MRLVQVDRRPEEVQTPGETLPCVSRIAVVRNDRLGDLVVTLPAVAAIRTAYPQAHLALVVRAQAAPLARMVGGIDSVAEDPGTLAGLTTTLRELRPDLVVSIALGARNALAGAAARVPHRVGPGFRPYSPLFHRRVNEHRSAGERHEVEYSLSYAHRCGAAPAPANFPLLLPPEECQGLEAWLRLHRIEGSFVVLHPGSGGSCPRWPRERYTVLSRALHARGHAVVISVGPADRETSPAPDEAKHFEAPLPALAALLSRASLVVSNSTGPLHLAAALGTPTLAIHAPWPTCGVARWGPYAENGWAIEADLDGAREWPRSERARRAEELMRSLPPEAVLEAALGLLDRRPRE